MDILWFCNLCTIAAIVESFRTHLIRSMVSNGPSVFRLFKTVSSSENVITHPASTTMTCSIRMIDAPFLLIALVPLRNDCTWWRMMVISLTSLRMIWACFGASLTSSVTLIRIEVTWAAAVSSPTTPAEMIEDPWNSIRKQITFRTRNRQMEWFTSMSAKQTRTDGDCQTASLALQSAVSTPVTPKSGSPRRASTGLGAMLWLPVP